MIMMIDNYDSFTYNLVQYLEELGEEIQVYKNDRISLEEVARLNPEAIIISPGPGAPEEAGISIELIRSFYPSKPILGVCLGHQSIARAFGGTVEINYRMMHGKVSEIFHDRRGIYEGIGSPFPAARYHSLVVREDCLPDCLEVTARSDSGEIMGLRHREYLVEGVQFHPESIMTGSGKQLLKNFLEQSRSRGDEDAIGEKGRQSSPARRDERSRNKMFDRYLKQVVQGDCLNSGQAYEAAKMLLHDSIPPVKAAAFLGALRGRKEKAEELKGFVQALHEEAVTLESSAALMDTCGTGGDHMGTFNVSTASALVVAACGVPVAKHGNAAVTSSVGSADVLEALGVNIRMTPEQALNTLDKAGITFLFAPFYNPILKEMGPLRREMGVATIFNFLGPLLNPFDLSYQVMGISDASLQGAVADTLSGLGRKKAMVIHAENGMDEVSPVGRTHVAYYNGQEMVSFDIDPARYGIQGFGLEDIKGGGRERNAALINNILAGQPGPHRDTVLLNAGLALMSSEKSGSLEDGMMMAAEAIDSGRARRALNLMIDCSQGTSAAC